jgi:Predicted membrane protein (DUF2142)
MVFFLAGSVNPNGLEITAAIALWAHVLAIGHWPERHAGRRLPTTLLVGLGISGGLLVLSRFLSPGFAVMILVVASATASRTALASVLRDRRLRASLVAVGICAAIGVTFTVATGSLQGLGGGKPTRVDNAWWATLGLTPDFIRQTLGWFGWLDTPPSAMTEFGWLLVIGTLLGAALLGGKGRTLLALAATIALTVAVPVIVQAPRLLEFGLTWQGRHELPLAVGIPLLAVVAAAQRPTGSETGLRRLAIVCTCVIGLVQVHALWWALHRYTVGLDSEQFGLWGGPWQPPGGSVLWLGLVGAFAVALVVMTVRRPRSEAVGYAAASSVA